MEDLEDIEQLRIAALQTLHAKKVEPRRQITPQPMYLDNRPSSDFESSISSFPGYNSRVQLSPRTAAFVESNISILNRRKEGGDLKRRKEDLDADRWSRSPSPLPKYKTVKRKSLSPLPLRRSPEQVKARSPPRKHLKPARSSPPVHAASHQQQVRRGDINNYPHGHGQHRSSGGGSNRHRERSRERHNGHRGVVPSRRVEHRPRTRSKSPVNKVQEQPRRIRGGGDEEKRRKQKEERSEEREVSNTVTTAQQAQTMKEKRKEEVKVEEKSEKEQPMEEEDDDEQDSSDSESSESSAIDLFASEESESENEGRFKCSSRTETSKVSFSSKMANKKELLDSVLPDVDLRERGGGRGRDRGFGGRRNHHSGRMEGSRDRPRAAFKSSFREVENGSSDKRRRQGNGTREEREDRSGEKGSSRISSSIIRKATTSEKL